MKNYNNDLDKLILEAEKHRHNKDYLLSIDLYKEALFFLENGEKIEVLFNLADVYGEVKNFVGANLVYNEIIEIDPLSSGAWYGIAFTNEILNNDIYISLDAYEKAIELDPAYKEAYYYAATIYGDLENYPKSISYLEKVIELDPEDYVAYNDLGSIYESQKDYKKAKSYLEKSISINDHYYLSYFNLGVVHKQMGDHEKAIEYYEKAKNLSDSRFIYLNMSAIYIEDNKLDEAIKILTEGIKENGHYILYYNRACSYKKLGKIGLALKDFEEAYNQDDKVLDWAKNDPDLKDIIKEYLW